MSQLPYLDAAAIGSRLTPRAAVDALAAALAAGLDPSSGPPRSIVPFEHGELLLMPAEVPGAAGVKVVSVAPDNERHGLPRIQGIYLLLDPQTLRPVALIDGIELTALRTPAVSLLAVRHRLRRTDEPLHIVAAGTGIQAIRHVETAIDVVADVRPIASVTYLSRRPEAFDPPTAAGLRPVVSAYGSAAESVVRRAGFIACATSSPTPLFDGTLVSDDAAVVAVGSHDSDRRELDEHLMGRAEVVVEDVGTALREGGDVICAIADGALDAESLISLTQAALRPDTLASDRPLVFKSSGMAWQDAVLAAALRPTGPEPSRSAPGRCDG